jgi:hypothetical protein
MKSPLSEGQFGPTASWTSRLNSLIQTRLPFEWFDGRANGLLSRGHGATGEQVLDFERKVYRL